MSRKSQDNVDRFVSAEELLRIANSPVLNFENEADFDRMRKAFENEVEPRGFVEQVYVSDFIILNWEIQRLRHGKKEMLKRMYWDKLYDILEEQVSVYLPEPAYVQQGNSYIPIPNRRVDKEKFRRLRALASEWFTNREKARQNISEFLGGYEIDEMEIETSVIQDSSGKIKALDDEIAKCEFRRDKALRCLAEYRYNFAAKLRSTIDSVIDGETVNVPRLENKSAKKSAA